MTIDTTASANGDKLDLIHAVTADIGTIFTWDYARSRVPLIKLYEKAKTSQWNASTDLDWSIDVDPEKVADELGQGGTARFQALAEAEDSPVKHFGEKEWRQVGIELQNSLLSQFMHGEQGALLCTARIVETVPWIDAKYYAATQVVDEARHVEVFARYLDEKLGTQYGINENLKGILDDILSDPRWDIAYLGMQIMVEGLALAAFGMMQQITSEPLLKKLLRYVMSDEARHVAFGVLSLQEFYKGHAEDHFEVVSLHAKVHVPYVTSKDALLTKEWTPLEPGVVDHKYYVRGTGTVLEQTMKGGDERNTLVTVRRGP